MIPAYLQREAEAYDIRLNSHPETVLDIGANVGAFSVRAAAMWPKAKIFAYEPVPANVKEFKKNCGNGRITIKELAVGGYSGARRLMVGKNFATNSFYDIGEQTGKTIPVQSVEANKLPEVEFIKVDTEGCELEILTKLPLGKAKGVACEYHRAIDILPIRALARRAGLVEVSFYPHNKERGIIKFARPDCIGSGARVFIAVPCYKEIPGDFVKCLLKLQANPPANLVIQILVGDSLVSRARNSITAEFLKGDCTHLMFIDNDLVFSSEQIARLLSFDVDVVAGFYPKKQDGPLRWVCNLPMPRVKAQKNGLQKMRYMGTGFMLIKRTVFEQMIEKYGEEISYHPDSRPEGTEWDFWAVGPHAFPGENGKPPFKRYLSEDWKFCQRWLDLGGEVWGDTRIVLKHIGPAVFPLQSQLAQISNPLDK